jgi:hypothetical protein
LRVQCPLGLIYRPFTTADMISPRAVFSSFLLASWLAAQNAPAVTPPTPAPAPQDPAQAEAADRPLTPEEQKAKLIDEVRKLQSELEFLRAAQSEGGLAQTLKKRLAERKLDAPIAEDPGVSEAAPDPTGAAAQPQPPAPAVKKARLLGDEEKKDLPEGTICTVDGVPVTEAEFQKIYNYLKSYAQEGQRDPKAQALEQAIRVKVAEAAFKDGAQKARDRMVLAMQKLKAGTDFAEVAKTMSDCPSRQQGGDLGFFGRTTMDLSFAMGTFNLQEGEVSEPVQTAFGYHLIKRTGSKKGDSADRDEVRASHILAMYTDDQFKVRGIQQKVMAGDVDLAFVSEEYRALAPAQFR